MRWPADPRARFALGVVACLFGFGLTLALVDWLAPTPKGPSSSSYATSPAGLAAYASVLERAGHPVRRVRTPIAERRPSTDETLVVLEPDVMEDDEARAIGAWVRAGGRLVAGGGDPSWLTEVLRRRPGVASPAGRCGARRSCPWPRPPACARCSVPTAAAGAMFGGALPVIGPADGPLLVTASQRRAAPWRCSPTPRRCRTAGSPTPTAPRSASRWRAASAVRSRSWRPCTATASGSGFGGLPGRVKWVIIGLALTALVAIWSAGRRLGPPEDPDIAPSPPRVEYVDALATALVRSKPDQEARS